MIKKFLQTTFFSISVCVFMLGCSSSNGGGGGGGVISGSSNVSADATSYFLSSSTAVQGAASFVSADMNRDDDEFDFDDDDGSLLYFKDKNNNTLEVIFNINGIDQRAYVDDLIYAGDNWLLAEIERFTPYTGVSSGNQPRRDDNDDNDDDEELLVMINTATADIKQIPTAQMRNCGNDIEKFEVIENIGYAICEDAAYTINLTDMSVAPIGIHGDDAYDNAAVTIFGNGTVLVTSTAKRLATNSSSLINVPADIALNFDAAETYEFTTLPLSSTANFSNVIVGGKKQTAPLTYTAWKNYIENSMSMGDYYHTQMKFLFGDMRYEDGDEIEVLDRYTKLLPTNGGISYKFGNFKGTDNKIYTLSLDEEYAEANGVPSSEISVALSEIAIDAGGKITRTVVDKKPITNGATGFSGILWNRKDTTSRHLDNQRAFDNESFFTANLTDKTVTKTDWNISPADFVTLSGLASQKQGRVYYGSKGIAFVDTATTPNALKYIAYGENAAAQPIDKLPQGCNVSKISIDGDSLYYDCGNRKTYMQDLTNLTNLPLPILISQKGKMIGNIIEVKKRR